MSNTIVNTINVDYPLTKSTQINNTTSVVSIAGARYPRSRTAVETIWDFGDGTKVNVLANDTLYRSTVLHLISAAPTFFPIWELYLSRCIAMTIPKFEYIHTYSAPGTYEITATIIHNDGTAYVSAPEIVTVKASPRRSIVPDNWNTIQGQYSTTTDLEKIYANRQSNFPRLSTTVESVSALPIRSTMTLTGVSGRVDVDYIKWSYGDDSFDVLQVLKSPVTIDMCVKEHVYALAPSINYIPTATIYASDGSNKFKFEITGNAPNWSVRSEVSTSVALGRSVLGEEYAFTITPRASDILPVTSTITHNVKPNLKYVIWDYDDGTYETIPVRYNGASVDYLQTVVTEHTYNSVNVNPILPSCLLVFHDPETNIITSEIHRARNYLDYQRGIINPKFDSNVVKIESDTNFTKRNNISVQVIYPPTNTGQATAILRLCFLIPKDILRYEKIIWEINGQSFIQDKNTAENFGYFIIKNIVTPLYNLNIRVQLYGIPAIVDGQGGLDLVFQGQWSYTLDILDKTVQENINENNKRVRNYKPTYNDFTLVPGPSSFVNDEGDEIIITPVIEIQSEEVVGNNTVPIYLNTDIVFDKLFSAANPAANFLNRDHPSTASTFTGDLASRRSVGFFKPSKTSTIIVDPGVFTFTLNLENVNFNTLYYFPDPFIYGSNASVLTFSVADNSFKRGILFSRASNEPNVSQDSISYYGYNSQAYLTPYEDLSYIYNEGYIHDFKTDVYGNVFGLVKDKDNFKQEVTNEQKEEITNITFNGYKFYDEVFGEGLAFDYNATGTDNYETIRTGLTGYTNTFDYSSPFYYLNFKRYDYNFHAQKYPVEIADVYRNPFEAGYRDGGVFMLDDNTYVAEPISSDRYAFPGNSTYFYTDLYEAGLYEASTLTRPLCDNSYPTINPSFYEVARSTGTNSVLNVDCGLFITNYPNESDIVYSQQEYAFIDEVDSNSTTTYNTLSLSGNDSLINRNNNEGVIYVKTARGVQRLKDALSYLDYKYTDQIYSEISNKVVSFDIAYDTYFIQTSGALVIDRLRYENDVFITPGTPNTIINYNVGPYNKISNRFKVDNNVYFSILSASNSNIIPFVYRFDTRLYKLQQVFPTTAADMESIQDLNISGTDFYYYEASDPRITYMRESGMYNVSFLMKDINKLPIMISVNFTETNSFTLKGISKYKFNSSANNILFTTLQTQDLLYTNLASNSPTFITGNKYYIL